MTEAEAKTKTCCGPIPALIGLLAVARPRSSDMPHATCIGSTCMAWRWANDYERRWDLPADQAPEGEGWNRVEAVGGVAHWVRQHKTPHGFCGLAGAAQ